MMRKRKTVVAKRVTPKVMTNIPKTFGILNDPLGNQIESKLMAKEEAEQRRYDRFWGQDKDQHDREVERKLMSEEDEASLKNEKWYETVAIHKKWDEEYQRNLWFENRSEAKYKEIERREYLKFVSSSLSSDEVINFVWNKPAKPAGEGQQESQGLVFSDLSLIGKEVALSLPSAVGALHMSIHLDGLQQSRAIVDEASTAFKQTLRRINSQSADDGDAAQPFKTNALAAEIIRTTKKKQPPQLSSPGSLASPGGKSTAPGTAGTEQVVPLVIAQPQPVPALDGHPLHKWDQELMLQLAFMTLDKGGKGYLTAQEVATVSYDSSVHALLSFTVFWASIKKRQWAFFQAMRGAVPALSPEGEPVTTLQDWMRCAQATSFEMAVPLRHMRTQEEHEQLCKLTDKKSSGAPVLNCVLRGVGAANVFSGLSEREHRVSRLLQEGDCVWALHNGGVVWLPAVVKAVHFAAPPAAAAVGAHRGTVTFSSYCYDLWYPLSQKELNKARTAMSARQLLALPSQLAAQRAMQDRLLLQRSLASGSQPFAGEGMDPAAALSKCLPVKPLLDERQVCAYAFDLVDSGGEGIVPLQRLVQCLQSLEFSRVVATSLALSAIFHGGSHAELHGAGARAGAIAGGAADLPSLLPVFIDTFSTPSGEEEKDGSAEDSKAGEDQDGGSGSGVDDQQGGQQQRPRRKVQQEGDGKGPSGDFISKLDFLEFCQAVADVKRYSVSTAQ